MRGKCYPITEAHKYGYDITLRFESIFNGKLHHFVPIITFSISYDKINQNEFLKQYPTPDMLTCTADKLRWYRLTNGYLQRDIADKIGVYRSTYIHYETPTKCKYSFEKLELLSGIYNISIEDLLDDYMLFLYNDQGRQIKALREKLGLSRKDLAELISVNYKTVKHWEQNKQRLNKDSYNVLITLINENSS